LAAPSVARPGAGLCRNIRNVPERALPGKAVGVAAMPPRRISERRRSRNDGSVIRFVAAITS
jgi:hypothetical protein